MEKIREIFYPGINGIQVTVQSVVWGSLMPNAFPEVLPGRKVFN
jgi:hypothetical protein